MTVLPPSPASSPTHNPAPRLELADLDRLAAEAVAPAAAITRFTVPPRFAGVSFESYLPDPRFPEQAAAVERLLDFLATLEAGARPRVGLGRLFGRARRPPASGLGNLYLDGSWGVGKTHLLASLYHRAPAPKAYLSFRELTYIIGALGMAAAIAAFQSHRLICIDEFELDDPGNTRLAATFFSGIFVGNQPPRVVATSNTIPAELGRGRFAAEDFQHELGALAAAFETVTVPGEDYRLRRRPRHPSAYGQTVSTPGAEPLPDGVVSPERLVAIRAAYHARDDQHTPAGATLHATFADLLALLDRRHPIRYAQMLDPLAALFLEGLAPMERQDIALRFVHFVDKLYDDGISLIASATPAVATLHDLFLPEYRDKGYAKKYRRCVSRLTELLDDAGQWSAEVSG